MISKITRLAASYQPPSISIEYLDSDNKLNYKQFDIAFGKFSSKKGILFTLENKFNDYFNDNYISKDKLIKFINEIVEKAPPIDLRTLPKNLLDKYKAQMDMEFKMSQLDDAFFNIEEDFENKESDNDWDS